MTWPHALAALSLLVWLYLVFGRRGFWRAAPRFEDQWPPPPAAWPEVVAIVPARNEAAHVATALGSLLAQDYPGRLTVILVDDHSEDGTRAIAERLPVARHRLLVIGAPPLPAGWSGKLWAVAAGLRRAGEAAPGAPYVLLTDADIAHAEDGLARLVAMAEAGRLDLVSVMVRLRCDSFWERLLIPPFVFFFRKLYPFAAVNDPRAPAAAAAGGCMLVRQAALAASGGIEAIRDRLIDDVALASAIKHRPGGGRIWLGLSAATRSLRRYDRLAEIWAMVARTADTQLRHSLLLLLVTVIGLALVYLLPPLALALGAWERDPGLAGAGGLATGLMTLAYWPTLRLYECGLGRALTLPLAAAFYAAMTVDSALRHRRGVGGRWKGRVPTAEA